MKIPPIFLFILFLVTTPLRVFAQETEATILQTPTDWRYEKIALPMDFAPEMTLQGFEELRFAPGMFDRSSKNYFTYIFALSIKEKGTFKKKDIKQFLLQYYRGLSKAVAEGDEKNLDFSKITVKIQRDQTYKKEGKQYIIHIVYLDTFNKGEEVQLQMEMNVISNKKEQHTYVFSKVSPQSKDHKVWQIMNTVSPVFKR